jgi:hypothetical protein
MKQFFLLLISGFLATAGVAQVDLIETSSTPLPIYGAKGQLYFFWGYNISGFSNSDIHIQGEDYAFTIHDAEAMDRPSPVKGRTYLHPGRFTIPQYNYRIGYFFKDFWSLSAGIDHMKYIFRNDQTANISGTISESASEKYAGTYDQTEQLIGTDFLTFEHSDGLNFVNVELARHQLLWRAKKGKQQLNAFAGIQTGMVIARSDVRVFDEGINNKFHLSGYGFAAAGGVRFHVYKGLFLQASASGGWINLPDVLTRGTTTDRASHKFWFGQINGLIGGTIKIGK